MVMFMVIWVFFGPKFALTFICKETSKEQIGGELLVVLKCSGTGNV